MPGATLLDSLVDRLPGPLAATLRMSGAAAGDLAAAFDLLGVTGAQGPKDPFAARDPEYIARTLPAWRLISSMYFRAEVRGMRNIPRDEPVLLVGNHSGGTLIADTFVFAQAFYDHFGPERVFHQLAHDLVFKLPGARALVERYGTVPASPQNMRRALDKGAALLVYPGGDHETYRPSWESGEIDFDERKGFARLSLELGVPIVPVVAIGGQETALFLGQGRDLARLLQLPQLLRVKVLPGQIAPPFGFTLMDLPGRIPLPAKITIRVLPKIDLRKQLGPRANEDDAYELVTGKMQRALTKLEKERTLPVVG